MEIAVVAAQFGTGYDKDANVRAALDMLDAIPRRASSPRLVCLPELFTVRRVERLGAAVDDYAEPVPGPLTDALGERARSLGAWIVGGSFLERAEDGRYHNTSVVLDPDGAIAGRYRKTHLFDAPGGHNESAVVTPGDELVSIKTDIGVLGVLLCYDLRFPEAARTLALDGVQILCVPNSWPIDALGQAGDQLRILLQATALQNLLYVVHANQFGVIDGDLHLCGRSSVVDPSGQVVAQAPDAEGLVAATIDLERVERMRRTRLVFRHHRPGLYRLDAARP